MQASKRAHIHHRITEQGAAYMEEEVFLKNRRPSDFLIPVKRCASAIAQAFGRSIASVKATGPNFVRHVPLRWLKPKDLPPK